MRYVFLLAFQRKTKSLYCLLYYSFVTIIMSLILLSSNINFTKDNAYIFDIFKNIRLLSLFVLISMFLFELFFRNKRSKEGQTFSIISALPLNENKKYLLYQGSEFVLSFFGIIIGLVFGIISFFVLGIIFPISETILFTFSINLLGLIIILLPFIFALIIASYTYLSYKNIKIKAFFHLPYIYGIAVAFLSIFVSKNIVVSMFFVFFLICFLVELIEWFYYFFEEKRKNKSSDTDYPTLFSPRIISKKNIASFIITLLIATIAISYLDFGYNCKKKSLNYLTYDYVIQNHSNDDELSSYLAEKENITAFTYISPGIDASYADVHFQIYCGDLSVIRDYYSFSLNEGEIIKEDNTIILPASFRDKMNVAVGDSIAFIINEQEIYLKVIAFINEPTNLLAFASRITSLSYDTYDSYLLKVSSSFTTSDITSDKNKVVLSKADSNLLYIKAINYRYINLMLIFLTVVFMFLTYYISMRIGFYHHEKELFYRMKMMPVHDKTIKRIIYKYNFQSFLLTFFIVVVLLTVFTSAFNIRGYFSYDFIFPSLSISSLILYLLEVLVVYNALFFIEYLVPGLPKTKEIE